MFLIKKKPRGLCWTPKKLETRICTKSLPDFEYTKNCHKLPCIISCHHVINRLKYYPSGDLLNYELKKGSSYIWQSIWSGVQTFKKGCIWGVGDGVKIHIWNDCWIPNSASRKVIIVWGNRVLTMVSELIDPSTREWDEQLIRDNFWPIDVDRILQIPIYHQQTEDFVAWHLTKNGIFSVRSAYYKQWEDTYANEKMNTFGQGGSTPHPIWKKLWNLKLPGKVRIFIWRCLHNAIPCLCVLANRHIGNNSQCPICNQSAEDISHALFKCERAKLVWEALGWKSSIEKAVLVDRSGTSIMDFLLCDQSSQNPYMEPVQFSEVVATTCWYLWWQRRCIVRQEEVLSPIRTSPAIQALTLNYVRATGSLGYHHQYQDKINEGPFLGRHQR